MLPGAHRGHRHPSIGYGNAILRRRKRRQLRVCRVVEAREDRQVAVQAVGQGHRTPVRDYLVLARNGGTWNGSGGITSSAAAAAPSTRAVGYAEASSLFTTFPATWLGRQVDNTSVLIRQTRLGDANLDGSVNLADFNRLAGNFGLSGKLWIDGDFNYDDSVNLGDFNALGGNYGGVAPSAPRAGRPAGEVEALLRLSAV